MTETGLSISTLTAGYRSGELSPVEVAEAQLAAIGLIDPRLNAFCLLDPDATLGQARASERRWRDGNPLSRIDGVPITIKDALLTAGWPMLKGSKLSDPAGPWLEDAPSVARCREAGAVFLGKTTTPEFAWKGVTDSPLTGITTNPWDPRRTSGGSSGGSAAVVAAGIGSFTLGSDGGGSIRIPASFCGVVGLKPTFGRVPAYPSSPFGLLSHVGPLAPTVTDLAEAMDVVARHDPRDPDSDPDREPGFVAALRTDQSALRVAFSPNLGWVDVDAEVSGGVARAVDALAAIVGSVEVIEAPFADPIDAFETLWTCATAKVLSGFPAERLHLVDPPLRETSAAGATRTAADYLDALAARIELGRAMARFHTTYDLLVTPTEPIVAFEAGAEVPEGSGMRRWTDWTPFTYPFNLTGQPAISIPCGFDRDGLPIGIQIVGRRYADETVVAVAHALEESLGLDRLPTVHARG